MTDGTSADDTERLQKQPPDHSVVRDWDVECSHCGEYAGNTQTNGHAPWRVQKKARMGNYQRAGYLCEDCVEKLIRSTDTENEQ